MTGKTTTVGPDVDRRAVLDVLAGVYRAWEAGDAEAFVAEYAGDASPASVDFRIRGAPSRGAALDPDPNVPGPQPRCRGRDRQSKTVWTWSAERKEP